ncbi:hypothetical protein N657DRAFT_611174 [Parathielavia appendiculata]|uniref:CHCH domain-containing protein n=1 Tax=Parathielavia appendiculata TaxID=2587402 RepID=A0AAN6U5R4_9PEZI|nr:hypothetical protein N657DRAFT_611174 [Parathielavia appendiculata]
MGSTTSKQDAQPKAEQQAPFEEPKDDEPDEWDKRIFSTGCADENAKLTDCYYEKKDWRACKDEMERFRQCWKAQGNDKRTDMKNV